MVGEVRTGRRITQIPVSDASWSMVHRGDGEIRIEVPLDAQDFARHEREIIGQFPGPNLWPSPETYPTSSFAVWRPGDGLRPEFMAALQPGRCFLAVLEGDTVLEAGPIWSWDYEYGGALKVNARGMWSLLEHRFVLADLADAWAEWAVTYTSLSLGTIAKRVVQLAETAPGGDLPIVYQADEAGVHERTYNGYDLATVRERVEQLMSVEGGPDVAFIPRLTADRMGIEWVMRTGTNAEPLFYQAGGDWVFDSRVPRGGVAGLSVKRDATRLAQRSYATGAGMQTALLMARATDTSLINAGFPLMETREARSSVEDASALWQVAAANQAASARPWTTWRLEVQAHPTADNGAPAGPQLGQYRPGDFVRVWVADDHPLLSLMLRAGFYRARILNVSGGLGDMVTIDLAPVMEVR